MKNKVEKNALLTVDSGGSKTHLSLYTLMGEPIRTAITKGYGLAVDEQEPLMEFADFLQTFCDSYKIFRVVCNLGGKNITQVKNTVQLAFPDAEIRIFREAHGVIGETLCEKYGAQVTLMAGTGSIAIAKDKDKVVISGGWGANISDDGSGYALGLNAIRLALRELDGVAPLSLLTERLTGVNNPPTFCTAEEYCALRDGVRAKLAPFDRANIAASAKVVYACAKDGDEAALSLYTQTGKDLAERVLLAAKKLGVAPQKIVVTGGLVHAKEFWQSEFEKSIREKAALEKAYYLAEGINEAMLDLVKNNSKER